ncbi:unnamed protein product [Schistosoma turkestanicum]|nr:unnamed protein product [Schistosoma turkestanicum]
MKIFTRSIITSLFLLINLIIWNLLLTSSWKMSFKHISTFMTLIYVHGGDDARLNHYDAMRFCQQLPKNIHLLNEKLIKNATAHNVSLKDYMNTTLNNKVNHSVDNQWENYILHGDLVSIHSSTMIHVIMGWILSVEPRQFWIGGLIKLIVHEFNGEHRHLIQTWTDRTPVTVRFLHHHSPVLERLQPNEIACLSIDYASGKWGVHYCTETKYFVCELLRLPNRRVIITGKQINAHINATTTTIVLHRNHTTTNTTSPTVLIIQFPMHHHLNNNINNNMTVINKNITNSTMVNMITTPSTNLLNTTNQTTAKIV